MLRDQPPRPANMANIVAINQGRRPLTMIEPRPPRLSAAQAQRLLEGGCLALDTRDHDAFARSHVVGAYSVQQSSGSFEQNVGWILPPEGDFLLVVDDAGAASRAARKLAFVGLDGRVAGFVEAASGLDGLPLTSLTLIDVHELQRLLRASKLEVLDVRERSEWETGHIPGAKHMSFKLLPAEIDRLTLTAGEAVAVVCAGGMRSSTACSILRRRGFEQVVNVVGGVSAWESAGLPLAR